MKNFVKMMCLVLLVILALSLVIACDKTDENVEPIVTNKETTPLVTTTAQETTTNNETTSETTTAFEISTGTTTSEDGFGPLIPLVTDK